jgi:2-polyprenyl-3-methyl-5-hydroxy-6-metoxy-1,4-benzoquinol methylase
VGVSKERADTETYSPSLGEQKMYWDQRWKKSKTPNAWQLKRGETVLEFLRGIHLDRPQILDMGCATGWFTNRLSHIGEATGIDLSSSAIAMAKVQYPDVRFIAGNLYEYPFLAGSFDIVVSQEVIAHVDDQVLFLERIADVLRPGGYFVVTTANKIVMERVDHSHDPREHIKTWLDMRSFKRLLRPRFDIIRTTSIIPMGNQGFLRVVNSHKLNSALGRLISRERLESWKEKAGLGYSLIILARKRF